MESFSSNVKKEVSSINNLAKKELVKAELNGYLLTSTGNIFTTENQYTINRYSKLLNNVGQDDYSVTLKGKAFCIKTKRKINIAEEITNEEEARAVVRGSFLGSGSISNPRSVYHLEIVFKVFENAKYINNILEKYNIDAKILERDKSYMLYIKDGENISKFLAFIGANKSVLDFEETRVMKDMRNQVNRIVNCETYNLNKVVASSVKQIDDIKLIKKHNKFDTLTDKERELAKLRLANPNATLKELGEMLEISKSGVGHRFEHIAQIAEELRNK